MWLLNIATRLLERFEGKDVPDYAILSHRWGKDEVSFQDIVTRASEGRDGYPKIDNFCRQIAVEDPSIRYIWIDTCCIDKSNHSELSEAINSMYRWYLQAKVCYAYLADVNADDRSSFAGSIWFSRGWTLQELLAPKQVEFFDHNWIKLGTKLELSDQITQITGIPADALENFDARRSPHSVADRMSWASSRQTTREEDLAYSLLGIFGVNMPLLYGEGGRAFLRLQEEILKISEDLTIFAWQRFPKLLSTNDYLRDTSIHDFSLFAASPESFDHKDKRFRSLLEEGPFGEGLYIAPLCDVTELPLRHATRSRTIAAMFVERTERTGKYRRVIYNGYSLIIGSLASLNTDVGRTQRIVLMRSPYHAIVVPAREKYGFTILQIENDISKLFQMNSLDQIEIIKRNPAHESLLLEAGEIGVAGMVRLSRRNLPPIYFHFGFDWDFNPFCLISRPSHFNPVSKEYKIVFETTQTHLIPVQCNTGILTLVSWLQAESKKFNLRQHNIELHMGSSKLHDMQFVGRDCRIALDVSAAYQQGSVYHVYIGLAHKDYPWATEPISEKWDVASLKEVRWYSKPWDQN